MKALRIYLVKRLGGETRQSEVEEELRFHLESLEESFRRKGMTPEAANAASRERFGDLEKIRRQCREINRRQDPIVRTLKVTLIVIFVCGLLLRIFSATPQFGRVADLSIAIAILGHLFLHLRGLLPAGFRVQSSSGSTSGRSSN